MIGTKKREELMSPPKTNQHPEEEKVVPTKKTMSTLRRQQLRRPEYDQEQEYGTMVLTKTYNQHLVAENRQPDLISSC